MALNKDRIFKAADKYIRSNKIEKAISEYETWLKENPKDWNTIRIVGDLYARISRNDEAIKKYAQVADHYRKDGFNVRAIATHKMVLRLDPQNEPAMRNLAELQAEEGLLMEAKSYYQTLVELYNKQGHRRLASEVFKKLAEIDPQDVKIRYKYADFLNKNGKPDEAALEYVGIADQFIGQGLVEEAIKILEQGRSLQTTDPSLKIKLAQASSMQGNHAQAVRMLEEVRRQNPRDANVLARLGEAYLAAGNTDEAQGALQELSTVQPGNPENVLRLADLRLAQGKYDTALEELVPLVDKFVGTGDGPKALELLQKVLGRDPYHVKTLLKLAEIHTILKQETGRISAYDSLCEAYSRAGDFEKAVQVAEQLVELDPESSQHKDRLKFFKSKLAGPARAPEPAPPPRPAAPPPRPAPPARAPAPARAAAAPPPRPAPPPAPMAEIAMDDLGFGEDLHQAVSAGLIVDSTPAPVATLDLGEAVELTQDEEENVKEKLTEAEVFVRYGLVDKALSQLLDVLESFRFHTETREKLIEIYKDQGMNREAGEQLLYLSQVYERLGRGAESNRAREEAVQLNPALAAQAQRAPDLVVEEEPELILAPETESDLDDVGIELDIPAVDDAGLGFGASPPAATSAVFDEPEIDIRLDEPAIQEEIAEEAPISVDWGADAGAADEIRIAVEEEEIPIAVDEELPEEVEFASTGLPESAGSAGVEEAIEIDVATSSVDISFSVDEESVQEEAEIPIGSSALDDEFEISIPDEAPAVASPARLDRLEGLGGVQEEDIAVDLDAGASELGLGSTEEEFSVEIDSGEDEISVEIPGATPVVSEAVPSVEEETFAPSFDAASDAGADIEIDIPDIGSSADVEMDLGGLSLYGADATEEVEEAFDIEEEIPSVEELELEPPPAPAPRPRPSPSEVAKPAAASPSPPAPPAPRPAPPPVAAAPPPAPAPAPVAKQGPFAAELEEVDEYIALGLYEDARDTLRELLKQHPGQPDIVAKIEELGFSSDQIQEVAKEPTRLLTPVPEPAPPPPKRKAPAKPAPEPEPVAEVSEETEFDELASVSLEDEVPSLESLVGDSEPEPVTASSTMSSSDGDDFIDLASELSEEIFGTHSAVEEEAAEPEGPLTDPGLDQIFREFRKGVEKQLGAEDYDTRYNLGIAYKEMGLLDEAIAEFQLAAKDEVRSLECCSMLGLCFMEKGMPDIAIKWFGKGLGIAGRRPEEYHGLRYDLAQAYEAAGQPERALELYMEIFRENIKFRDVQERVKELQAARK